MCLLYFYFPANIKLVLALSVGVFSALAVIN